MTHVLHGGARASTILVRARTESDLTPDELARLFGLDRLPFERRLVCGWHRDGAGRLACAWEIDVPAAPLHLSRRG